VLPGVERSPVPKGESKKASNETSSSGKASRPKKRGAPGGSSEPTTTGGGKRDIEHDLEGADTKIGGALGLVKSVLVEPEEKGRKPPQKINPFHSL